MKTSLFAACVFFALTCAAAESAPEFTTLFEPNTGGYALYRIPGIAVTSKGTVIACCEARQTGGDWAKIDIVMRRSTDGAKTWDAMRKIVELDNAFEKKSRSQKARRRPERYHDQQPGHDCIKKWRDPLLYCVEYMRCFYARSDDDGATFSKPVEITKTFEAFRPEYDWKVLATGPGHSIELDSGRLLVPVWLSTSTGPGSAHRPSAVATIFSEDGGASWTRGALVSVDPQPLLNPSETVAVQLNDGRVMLNMRNESKNHRRAIAFSIDGATNWSTPEFADALREPICMGSLIRLNGSRLLFANPDSAKRENLSIRVSHDDGKTWPLTKILDAGPSAYSDLAMMADRTILCLYEKGSGKAEALTLARINADWLEK